MAAVIHRGTHMPSPLLSVSEAADALSERSGASVTPRLLSDAIYRRIIPPALVTTLADRKLLAAERLGDVLRILTERGLVPCVEEVES